ncbi:hypothetical protein C1646_693714 [Rhizophagus diaphanus]|nr:hypothetical protein C1646_693714 [Rhizophagus diaphanus] [Rhizophagus sp. MUCL 43196]
MMCNCVIGEVAICFLIDIYLFFIIGISKKDPLDLSSSIILLLGFDIISAVAQKETFKFFKQISKFSNFIIKCDHTCSF